MFTHRPIVFSRQCAVIHTAKFVEKYGNIQFTVDFETIAHELQACGLPPEVTESMAVVLHAAPPRDLKNLHNMTVGGWFGPEPMFVDGLSGWRMAVHLIVGGLENKRLNHIVWHEFGHAMAYFQCRPAVWPMPKYRNKALVQAFQRWAACAAVICTTLTALLGAWTLFSLWFLLTMPGIALTMVALYAARFPRSALWHLDANERAAERFARKRKRLKVIHLP